ncbi:hypothetical protein E2320_003061 [Naja naja]|nr:hypothetical protein E2320_003061 [Naja naja]
MADKQMPSQYCIGVRQLSTAKDEENSLFLAYVFKVSLKPCLRTTKDKRFFCKAHTNSADTISEFLLLNCCELCGFVLQINENNPPCAACLDYECNHHVALEHSMIMNYNSHLPIMSAEWEWWYFQSKSSEETAGIKTFKKLDLKKTF